MQVALDEGKLSSGGCFFRPGSCGDNYKGSSRRIASGLKAWVPSSTIFSSGLADNPAVNMTKTPFAKSSSKTALMERLGLYGPEGERIYVLLYVSTASLYELIGTYTGVI
jgi:hypothetical protein